MHFKLLLNGLAVCCALMFLWPNHALAEPISESEVDAAMKASPSAPIYSAVQKYFPEDFTNWRKQLTKLAKRNSGEIVFPSEALGLGADIRKRHAQALQFASGESLRKVMAVQYAMHAKLKDNPDACNRLILGGPKELTNAELDQIATISGDIEPQFAAMHQGTKNPVHHSAPTQDAWQGFYDSFLDQGNSNEEYDLILEPKHHPALCSAFLGFFAVLRDGEFEGADAIRAAIVPALVGS